MKNKFTKLLTFGLTLFAIGLLMTNCQKENIPEEVNQVKNQEQTLTLKHYSKTNIEKNTKLVSKLKKFNDKVIENKSSKLSGKNVYNEKYDFTIYTDSATYIEDGDYHSYTFPLIQGTDEKITNILFELNDENEYDAFIVEYDYSANDLKYKDFKSLSMKTSMRPIDLDLNSLFAKTKSAYVCLYSYDERCTNGWVSGSSSHGGGNLGGTETRCNWVLTASYCETVLYYDEDYKKYHQGNTATVTIGGTTYGGTGGSRTSPIASPFDREELIKIDVVKNRLNLNRLEKLWIDEWVNGQYAFQLYDFIKNNAFSDEAITEANARLYTEMLDKPTSNTITITWKPNTGTYLNRENLKYTKTAEYRGMVFYNLENGLILISSGQKQLKTSKDTSWSSETNSEGHHYIYSRDTKRLYEYQVPPANYADADIDFLLDAFWSGVATTARYATPLEDAIILIDGKDFDGVEQNKAATAGFMIVGFIPGGKILKPISKVVKNSDTALAGWKVIAKIGDDTVQLSFKVVNGIVDFGSRSKLATIIKTTSLEEVHHMIPWNKLGDNVIQEAAYAGFHMNSKVNGKALQKFTKLTGEGIHGNHPAYDKYIQKRLDDFSNNDFDSDSAKDFLENTLIPKLDELIELAKNSDLNLNEYFKQVVNPPLGIN